MTLMVRNLVADKHDTGAAAKNLLLETTTTKQRETELIGNGDKMGF